MEAPVPVVCPACRGALREDGGGASCGACGARFGRAGAFVAFAPPDPSYDLPASPWWDEGGPAWRLPMVDAGITRFLRRHVPEGALVLDVGCGAGIRDLARRRRVVGVDRSPARLDAAARIYADVRLAAADSLPFPDGAFDAVVSVDVLEHVPDSRKDAVIAEWVRVARRGGRLVHLLDCKSSKPLHAWARRRSELHRRHFVEAMGHHGLETASATIRRFRAAGIRPLEEDATSRTSWQVLENWAWQFDNEYAGLSWRVRQAVRASHFLRRHRRLRLAHNAAYFLWTRTLERLWPLDSAFNLAVAYEKP